MTQKREIWQPSCLGYLASLSLHVLRNMHVSTYQKISLHLPSFWGKIVLFKASCQKTSLSSWIIRLLFLPLSTLFFRRWTEVFLTFLLLLVSGDRTALGKVSQSLSPCCHFWGIERTTPVALPSLLLLLWHIFLKEDGGKIWWGKDVLPVRMDMDRSWPFLSLPHCWVLEIWTQAKVLGCFDNEKLPLKDNHHVTRHVEPTIVGLKEGWGVRMEMGQKYSQKTRKFYLLQDEWI